MWWPLIPNTPGLPGFSELSDTLDADEEFVMGSILALRAWGFDPKSRVLLGCYNKAWHAGENRARCHRMGAPWTKQTEPQHASPSKGCGCGFWGYWAGGVELAEVRHYNSTLRTVVGVAEMYGRTTEGTKGIRSEKARIRAMAPGLGLGAWEANEVRDALTNFDPAVELYENVAAMITAYETRFTPPPEEPAEHGEERK